MVVNEEERLLGVVLKKLDAAQTKATGGRGPNDAKSLVELRDALAEAKPEDQGSILEQMHRLEALSRQRGKGDAPLLTGRPRISATCAWKTRTANVGTCSSVNGAMWSPAAVSKSSTGATRPFRGCFTATKKANALKSNWATAWSKAKLSPAVPSPSRKASSDG